MRLLLVEDDALLGEGIQTAFRRAAITIDWLRDGESVAAAVAHDHIDVIVLDLGLPRKDGIDVIRQLRASGCDVPILVLTARDRVGDRVQALDLGADDFLGKPFDPSELLARVRALHRRGGGRASPTLTVGEITLDPANFRVTWQGNPLELPRREFATLQLLMERAGRVVSREALQQQLYGWDEEVSSNAIEVHIHSLRRKLDSALIKTVRGVGYILSTAPTSAEPSA